MKQAVLFEDVLDAGSAKYTQSAGSPVYEPKRQRPDVITLCDKTKVSKLLREINCSTLPEREKEFLRMAAWRHAVFNYELIADYYSHASEDMQRLMEESALIIIDMDSAIEKGFLKLCEAVRAQYLQEYRDEK